MSYEDRILDKAAKPNKPFFMSVNFAKMHQPHLPHPDFINKSISKTKFRQFRGGQRHADRPRRRVRHVL